MSIKKQIFDPALEDGDLDRIEKAVNVWKTAAKAEKLELETTQTTRKARTDAVRYWVPILAPLLGAAALVGTVIFQVEQLQATSVANQQAAEDTAWRTVLDKAKDTRGTGGPFSLVLMKSFLDSDRYGKAAREISVFILSHMTDVESFKIMFPDLMRRTTWSNVRDIIGIGASLDRAYYLLQRDETDRSNGPLVRQITGGMPPPLVSGFIIDEMNIVESAMASFLQSKKTTRPETDTIDLTGFQFAMKYLDDIDLSRSVLRNSIFYRCTVSRAAFRSIRDFRDSDWEGTIWWRAGAMDGSLLADLEKRFPFKESNVYAGPPTTRAEYESRLKELRADAGARAAASQASRQ